MKPVATRNFPIQVSREDDAEDDDLRRLTVGILEVRLNRQFDIMFIPFEPPMAPPFQNDTTAWQDVDDWRTPADARLAHFYRNRFAVTAHDPLAGQELRYPSQFGAPVDEVGDGRAWKPRDGVVFYTSTGQYETLMADLEQFLVPYTTLNFDERALDLQGRPVVDFLVERLQTSRLVPNEMLHWLGLERAVTT
jgi:hypothetical protein